MKTSSLIAGLTIATLGFSSLIVNAAPLSPPDNAGTGVPNQGIFATYFQNLALGCAPGSIMTDLDSTAGPSYLKPTCSTLSSLLAGWFSTLGLSGGPIVFNSSGTPTVYDFLGLTSSQVNNLVNQLSLSPSITNIFNNPSYTGSLNTYLTQYLVSNPVASSQWGNVTGGIIYTGGVVQVGSSAASSTKIGYTWGPTIFGSTIDPSAGSTYIGWNTGLGKTHIGNGAGSYGDLYAAKIGIGTTTPRSKLDVNGEIIAVNRLTLAQDTTSTTPTWHMDNSADKFRIFRQPNIATAGVEGLTISHLGAQNFDMRFYGNITANGFLYSSDRNLKKNIAPLEGSLEKIMKLNGYSYNWKSTGKADMGVIAQEVETVYPDLVHTNSEGVKSVEYANLIAPLIEAVKTQQKEIELLKAEVAGLKK